MKNRRGKFLGLLILLALSSASLWSCRNIFAPELGDLSSHGGLYRSEMRSIDDVLSNFRYAYIYQDSLVYARLLDSAFTFIYYLHDDQGGGGQYASWGKDLEMRTTAGVFRTFAPIDLIWNTSLDSNYYLIENEQLLRSQKSRFLEANFADMAKTFQLNLGTNIIIVGTAIFDFRRDPIDKQWRLYRWRDESVK
ncbi:MAG TPA: hypothetical protein ENN84_08060 [Candidatus Marinimicrobia bacterium]|nr:hypothetical protein [Candidatus Neomarinimicrobiota bacterium]